MTSMYLSTIGFYLGSNRLRPILTFDDAQIFLVIIMSVKMKSESRKLLVKERLSVGISVKYM